VGITDPLGRLWQKAFSTNDNEVVGRLVDPDGYATTYAYDGYHNLTNITDALGYSTQIGYEPNGAVSLYIPPSKTKSQTFQYNPDGTLSLAQSLTFDKIYQYDTRGNRTQIRGVDLNTRIHTYVNFTYDSVNRETSYTDAATNTIQHVYDAVGNVSSEIYPDGKTVKYTYDAAGRLLTVTDWANRVTSYTWNSFNQPALITFPNQTSRVMQYDNAGRLQSQTDYDAQGGTIVSYKYS
jgi:YD repeat-containing protein